MPAIENFPENLISFFISPSFTEWLLIIKIIFIVLSLLFICFIIFALMKTSWLKFRFLYDVVELLTYRPFGVRKMEKSWKKIAVRTDTGLESEYKLAVIEADNMLDEILKKMGYGGESLGERLEKLTAATLPDIEGIREVHQVRNNIIHDPNYKLSLNETRRLLDIFEKAFKDLEAF
ncbi:MAG: hypothetical protein Q8N87_04040 [bacterium]|nr:hypothetical protein [bacterium]